MMKNYLVLLVFVLAMSSGSWGQLVQVFNEVHAVDGVPGYTTYRIYAEMESDSDHLSAIFAYADEVDIELGSSSNTIWNHPSGEAVGSDLGTGFCDFDPTLCYDSYLTIGDVGGMFYTGEEIECGSAVTAISAVPNGSVFTEILGNQSNGNLVVNDGAIFTLNNGDCAQQSYAHGPDNLILLGQVTIPSEDQLHYRLSLSIFINGNGSDAIHYFGTSDFDTSPTIPRVDGTLMGLVYPYGNCNDPVACNYNEFPNQPSFIDACEYDCPGCTDPLACNYNEMAFEDDGSCMSDCPGCMDTTADNYYEQATYDDGTCEYFGCTDSAAANYDSSYNVEDGSCIYPGCTVSWATNYDSSANENDGTCQYQLSGYVIYDPDYSGDLSGDDEYGIAYQNVTLLPNNVTVITDENGYYQFDEIPSGEYTLMIDSESLFPFNTTVTSYDINEETLENTPNFNFGFAYTDSFYGMCVDLYPWATSYPCNDLPVLHNICFRNMSSEVASGIVALQHETKQHRL